ncbi:hypothetical protein SAMN06295912_102257 [Sphingomonas laterariae]|uniref:Uncharacterized protein n=1 Tax=Edaphosphingomonas laterariae TaxID=861865 RepID=A0A239CLY1_9SPHN|nr:hypothetical protein SAMN06295912_102257 [Sphingomonas laterariae]
MVKRCLEFLAIILVVGNTAMLLSARGDSEAAGILSDVLDGASHDDDPDYLRVVARRSAENAREPAPEVVAIFMSAVTPAADATAWRNGPTPEALASNRWPATTPSPADRPTGGALPWFMFGGAIAVVMWRMGARRRGQLGQQL